MNALLKKSGGVWYIETLLKGLVLVGLGFPLVSFPFWGSTSDVNLFGLISMLLGVPATLFGAGQFFYAKGRKNRENPYPDFCV